MQKKPVQTFRHSPFESPQCFSRGFALVSKESEWLQGLKVSVVFLQPLVCTSTQKNPSGCRILFVVFGSLDSVSTDGFALVRIESEVLSATVPDIHRPCPIPPTSTVTI